MVFEPADKLLEVDRGGIYLLLNTTDADNRNWGTGYESTV